MEQPENFHRDEHVINVTGNTDAPCSSSHDRNSAESVALQSENRHSTSGSLSLPSEISVNRLNSSRNTLTRTRDTNRRRSPLNSGFWISIQLVLTMGQIIAAIVVLTLSRDEHPHVPLFAWVVVYASGCSATLPLLYWQYHYRNQTSEQGSAQSQQSSQVNSPAGSLSLSVTQNSDRESQEAGVVPRNAQTTRLTNTRVKVLVEYFRVALDCFFAVWFVVGNVWVYRGHSSASDAPNLYRLCLVFLAFGYIGYAMPFIFCATICCCLPCIISILGFREGLTHNKGATPESINALPTYKFKLKKNKDGDVAGAIECGIVAAGTEKERIISGEDAACCICLARYANNDELRELPCSHIFHKECVGKWLKINALCPLCKEEVGESVF